MKRSRLKGSCNSIVQLHIVLEESLLPRITLGIAIFLLLITVNHSFAGKISISEAMAEKSIGSPDAPITMIEYSSLTCSHCAAFHTDT